MAELLEEASGLESTTIAIYRTSATVKGGRRFSFGALVVVGDRRGSVGLGYAKAPGVPAAIEKAQKAARKNIRRVDLIEGTLPHTVNAAFGASSVKLVPASAGTGVIAGGTVRAILEMAGVHNCLTKAYGSTNQRNLARAAIEGLYSLRTKAKVEELRGVKIVSRVEEILDAGRRYAAPLPAGGVTRPKPARKDRDDRGGKGRGRGGGGGRGRGGGGGGRGRNEGRGPSRGPGPGPASGGEAPKSE
jgi:small subunit ribosomal protein S5